MCPSKDSYKEIVAQTPITMEFARESLESAGLSVVAMDILPLEEMPAEIIELVPGATGEFVVTATKT